MFSGFFNYDNPVWRFIGKFWDVIILSVLWMVCSIPIVTIGASTTAMYYVTLKLVRDEDGYTFRSFFKSFKDNFKQSTIIWLIFLFAGMLLGFDLFFFMKMFIGSEKVKMVMLAIFFGMSFIYLAMFTYVFPLQARFFNPVKRTIFNSFFMAIRHIFQTIGILVIDVGIVFLALTYIPQILIFGVALIAFVNSYMLAGVFKKYIPEDTDHRDDGELRPLFEDEPISNQKQ
ncbi:MAG: DUF624 domain-containing protein [Hungatella sp.]